MVRPPKGGCPAPGRAEAQGEAKVQMVVTLPPDYRPSDDEEFMNALQQEYFRQKLLRWRHELLREAGVTLNSLSAGGITEADLTDRASVETDRALERIVQGTYGFCEESGEPIGLRRLEARPIATMSIEAQERHERMEKVHRDD